MNSTTLKGVLIDIDGTLLDSNDAHTRAWLAVLRPTHPDVSYEQIRSLIGKGGDKLLSETVGIDDESDEGKALGDARRALFKNEMLATLRPTRGARDLLQRLRDDGLLLVIATSAGGSELEGLLRQAGVDDLIHEATTSSDSEHSKPDPDIIDAALKKAGLAADEVVMIGDTPYDIESASKAGVRTIALRCGGHWSDADFVGAAAIYADPAALLEGLNDSPLARDA